MSPEAARASAAASAAVIRDPAQDSAVLGKDIVGLRYGM
jgi:hypothetical protein